MGIKLKKEEEGLVLESIFRVFFVTFLQYSNIDLLILSIFLIKCLVFLSEIDSQGSSRCE